MSDETQEKRPMPLGLLIMLGVIVVGLMLVAIKLVMG